MGSIAADLADFTIITSDNPRTENPLAIIKDIERGALSRGAKKGQDYTLNPDRRQALNTAVHIATQGDCLLIAGKGHERVQILSDRTVPFDDRLVVAELLQAIPLV